MIQGKAQTDVFQEIIVDSFAGGRRNIHGD